MINPRYRSFAQSYLLNSRATKYIKCLFRNNILTSLLLFAERIEGDGDFVCSHLFLFYLFTRVSLHSSFLVFLHTSSPRSPQVWQVADAPNERLVASLHPRSRSEAQQY